MHEESTRSPGEGRRRLERAIVLLVLADDRAQGWSCAELGVELDAPAGEVREALARLHRHGIVTGAQQRVRASGAARRLDELALIAV